MKHFMGKPPAGWRPGRREKVRNERTSPRVARIASKILSMRNDDALEVHEHPSGRPERTGIRWRDIRALAAAVGVVRNEQTSARVANIAAHVLKVRHDFELLRDGDGNVVDGVHRYAMVSESEWKEVRALAASCLTQAGDRPKGSRS